MLLTHAKADKIGRWSSWCNFHFPDEIEGKGFASLARDFQQADWGQECRRQECWTRAKGGHLDLRKDEKLHFFESSVRLDFKNVFYRDKIHIIEHSQF